MRPKKAAIFLVLSIIIIVVFLYGYAFLYDYYYSANFPEISIFIVSGDDPTAFSDQTVGFVVEMANMLKEIMI